MQKISTLPECEAHTFALSLRKFTTKILKERPSRPNQVADIVRRLKKEVPADVSDVMDVIAACVAGTPRLAMTLLYSIVHLGFRLACDEVAAAAGKMLTDTRSWSLLVRLTLLAASFRETANIILAFPGGEAAAMKAASAFLRSLRWRRLTTRFLSKKLGEWETKKATAQKELDVCLKKASVPAPS